jgi:acyl-CoA synthetase (AMP-forming)/AMP-acid ligase II
VSLDELLFGRSDPDAVLVHFGDGAWTRGDVQARAEGLAGVLTGAGVELATGAAVGVMLPNGLDPVAALFGVWRAGGVYVPLNPRLTGDEVDHIMASVDPAAVVTTAELAERFTEGFVGRAVVVATDAGWSMASVPAAASDTSVTSVKSTSAVARGGHRRHGDDVALIQFTSGTTGRPKPVLLLHSGVLTLLDGVLAKLRPGTKPPLPDESSRRSSRDPSGRSSGAAASEGSGASTQEPSGERPAPMPNLIPVSLSLWAGIYNVLFALRVGAPVVVMDGFDPTQFAELVRRFGIRSTVLPPAAMTMLTDDSGITDLSPLRFVRSITAPLSPLQARRFHVAFGISVLNSYGQTEIGGEIVGWNAADSRAHGQDKLGSVGRAHEGVSLRVVDDQGVDVGVDEPGELWVRTPALSAGYADGGDLSDRMSADGWFRTGDYARVDADGFVWIEGRVSAMINRGGLKVYPGEVEEVLRLHPDVADVAVVGAPDDRLGEVPWAFVVLRDADVDDDPDSELDSGIALAAELRDGLEAIAREHLAPYKVPAGFRAIAELPRNEVGKILAHPLIDLIGSRR